MTDYKILEVAQADGAVRFIALDPADHDTVRANRAMLDRVRPAAMLDVDRGGRREWQPCRDESRARAAIMAYIRGDD